MACDCKLCTGETSELNLDPQAWGIWNACKTFEVTVCELPEADRKPRLTRWTLTGAEWAMLESTHAAEMERWRNRLSSSRETVQQKLARCSRRCTACGEAPWLPAGSESCPECAEELPSLAGMTLEMLGLGPQ